MADKGYVAISRVQRQRRVSFPPGLMKELNLKEGDKILFRRVEKIRSSAIVVARLDDKLKE
ncbi:hypothetical protein ES703_99369 [subsurface metagenome]